MKELLETRRGFDGSFYRARSEGLVDDGGHALLLDRGKVTLRFPQSSPLASDQRLAAFVGNIAQQVAAIYLEHV